MRALARGFAGIASARRSGMRRVLVPLFVLVLTACASAPQAPGFDVTIAQNDDGHKTDFTHTVGLDITVSNGTSRPWTVEGLTVQTVSAAPFHIPRRAERWDEPFGPGEAKTFHYHWPAAATVGFGAQEIPIRVELHLIAPDGTRRTEAFVR